MTFFGFFSFPLVNLLYNQKLSPQPDRLLPTGSTPNQPLTSGPKSDYLLITGHSLPLSFSGLLPHLHTVWQDLHLPKHHDGAQGIAQPPSGYLQLQVLLSVLQKPEGDEPELKNVHGKKELSLVVPKDSVCAWAHRSMIALWLLWLTVGYQSAAESPQKHSLRIKAHDCTKCLNVFSKPTAYIGFQLHSMLE